jgi:cytoskeleton protein RodZ
MSVVENRQLTEDPVALPGRRLAAARTAQNLSAADIARQLKLSVWQVEALEAGLYGQLPGPIFVRGFIRNYARLVKLDPDELVKALGDSVPPPAPRAAVSPSRDIPFPAKGKPRWAIVAIPAVVIVGLLAAYEFLWNEPDSPPATPPAVSSAPQPARTAAKPATTVTTPAAAVAEGKSAATSVKVPATKPEQDAQPATAAAASDAPRKPARRGERELKLAFNQECWVEIRDRNERVIFSQLNRPGTQQSVSGLPPFSVVVGNAHGVQLTYDDKPVDLAPHTKIDVARLILQ